MTDYTLNEYQEFTDTTAKFPTENNMGIIYTALGLTGEAGEYSEKVKKLIRDKNSILTEEYKEQMIKELGDVLYYLAQSARMLSVSLEEVAKKNRDKLTKRLQDNKIHGEGDNR